jgi:aspartyl aminopeptidase
LDSVSSSDSLSQDPNIRLIALFDNEEVGSETAQGAASSLLVDVLNRLSSSGANLFEQSVHKSFFISADMAHASNP